MSVEVTVDEIVSLLQRTGLPTVIIEGGDDAIVYRGLEIDYSEMGLSVLPVGGREKILKLVERYGDFSNDARVAFIVDMDIWVNVGVPQQYNHYPIVFTWGYSIENDLYSDGNLERMLSKRETESFKAELARFIGWYALVLSRHLADASIEFSHSLSRVLDNENEYTRLCQLLEGETYPLHLKADLEHDYIKKMRGKSLLRVLMRQLSRRGRKVKHAYGPLMEMIAVARGPNVRRIYEEVAAKFA